MSEQGKRGKKKTRQTTDFATGFRLLEAERRTSTQSNSHSSQEHSPEQTNSPTTETVTQTQSSETPRSPLSSNRQLETERPETAISTTSSSIPPPSDPMTMQQTGTSLEDLISMLRMLQANGEKKKTKSPFQIASTFLTEVDLYLMANDTLYPNNKDKILFTLSYMKEGHATKWMEAKTNEYKKSLKEKLVEPANTKPEDQIHLMTWEEFLDDFKKAFQLVDIGTNAQLKLKNLKQNKKHVDEYITDFRLLAIDSEYNDRALIDHFMAGLHPALLKSCLSIPDQPNMIKEWYDRARKEKGQRRHPNPRQR
ncbi:hypothetical protein WG66_013610 [Moniliophthora roreri]|nr:hypothetical protein WG66_013610 [Moniliophthora roreri]